MTGQQVAGLHELIAAQARQHPDRTAIEIAGAALSYSQLIGRVGATADWLIGSGVSAGDRVLVTGANSIDLLVAALAALWIGAVEVVANPSSTHREFVHIVSDCSPAVVLADPELLDRMPVTSATTAALPSAVAAASTRPPRAPTPVTPGTLASLQYTSGTTGTPKGAVLTHRNLVSYLTAVIEAWQWDSSDVLVHSLPLSHGHGRNGVYTALLSGASAVVLLRTDPAQIMETLRSREASVFYAVPAIWDRLLSSADFDPTVFAGLRLFTSGSAPLSPALSDEVARRIGQRPLERYGCTETGIVTTNPLAGPRIAGTVGTAMPGAEVAILSDCGVPAPAGQTGEVAVRGPMVFAGYWGIDRAEHVTSEGWFRTGDLGRFAPEHNGHLVISGRRKEMIISGGLNVYPREVELVAESAPGVGEAAACGIPSPVWGEQVVVAVVPDRTSEAPDPVSLLEWMRTQLAAYKVPKQCKLVREIPRNSTGKILRHELAARWEDL